MKVIAWNVRGDGHPFLVSQIRKLLKNVAPDILFLCETKANANRSMNILPKLQFNCYEFIDPIGLSGGLWLCWNSNVINLDIILQNDRMIHCMGYVPDHNIRCFFTFLYGYPQHYKQKKIWDTLLHIKYSINGPWAIIGDFNEILYPHEKIGGNQGNTSRIQDFGDFINNCQLLDLESFGLPYTWFNKRKDLASIFKKLDRVLINEQ